MPAVAVIGASTDRSKFGNKAVRAYAAQGWTVYPVHPKEAAIEGIPAFASIRDVPGPVDRVALYVGPQIGVALLDDIKAKGAMELFVNPGAESDELMRKADALGLNPILGCALSAIGVRSTSL